MPQFDPLPYRIRIGIVGRRSLPDAKELSRRVSDFLGDFSTGPFWQLFKASQRELLAKLRGENRTPIFLELLSPLAEGADRLAAEVVLARESQNLWPFGSLRAVLPLAEAEYLTSFEVPGSTEEFHKLLAASRRPVRLDTCLDTCRSQAGVRTFGNAGDLRNRAYDGAGRYVVDHCDLLIALWDGQHKPLRADGSKEHDGTLDAVNYARIEGVPVYRIWTDGEELLNPDALESLDLSAAQGIDLYNHRPVLASAADAELACLEQDLFAKYPESAVIPDAARHLARQMLFPHYCRTSVVADECQRQYYDVGKWGYTLAAVAVACAAVGVLFEPVAPVAFLAEIVALACICWMKERARKNHAHGTWIEHRFLAERLRAAQFMALCGVEPRPMEVPEYMEHSQSENDWTIHAFDEIWSRLPDFTQAETRNSHPAPGQFKDAANYICKVWIGEQESYHKRKSQTEGMWRKRLSWIGEVVLPLSILAATLHLLLFGLHWWIEIPKLSEGIARFLISFIALVAPAVSASIAGFTAHREHQRLEKRSANMVRQLAVLGRRMDAVETDDEFRSMLQDLDEEVMLRELQDWLMLMKYVEIKAG